MTFSDILLAFIPDIAKSIWRAIPNSITKYKLKRFFGPSVLGDGNFWLVVDSYYHPLPRAGNRFIKKFLGRKPDQPLIGEDRVLGSNILRLLGYLAAALGQYRDNDSQITFVADEDVESRWDGTMICFGSSDSNLKTLDVEGLPQNGFYKLKFNATGMRCFEVAGRDYNIVPNEDKAIILRIRNPRSPEHWLFVCAGLGEWGTSGSTRYLFTHWKQLHKRYKDHNFIVVVAVKGRSDENVEELYATST
ncbi:hypothetical protein [Stygiobacter electus]|uniref:Uncharacterized protein n=1 Tax=Stygiobacter electus TaxID=3032292 RepID=A0AAE3P091_9BACT|nr:hypothetical protein [Stygiobacter electus]MDF1613311.1 hypothetical protein [Stygiobacter electus]